MTKRFTLVTTDGDNSMPSRLPLRLAKTLLAHPLLDSWYTQNYDGSIAHPRLFPFPMGFDIHTERRGFEPLRAARQVERPRQAKILLDKMAMTSERRQADQELTCIDHDHKKRMPVEAVWDEYGSYTFSEQGAIAERASKRPVLYRQTTRPHGDFAAPHC